MMQVCLSGRIENSLNFLMKDVEKIDSGGRTPKAESGKEMVYVVPDR